MKQKKTKQLITILIDKDYHSSSELENKLAISSQSVKKLIKKINQDGYGQLTIKSKTNRGYYLETKLNKNKIFNLITSVKEIESSDFILIELLLSTDFLKIEQIQQKHFFSYSKLYAIIQKLKSDYQIETDRKLGFKLKINLFSRKILIAQILEDYIETIDLELELVNLFKQFDQHIKSSLLQAIKLFKDKRLQIKSIVYVNCLIMYVLETIIPIEKKLINQDLKQFLLIDLDQSSFDFWNGFIVKKTIVNKEIQLDELLDYIYRISGQQYQCSKADYDQFQTHLNNLLQRNVTTDLHMPIVDDFNFKYPLASESAQIASKYIESKAKSILNSLEKLYLAIHFQKLINADPTVFNVMVVCQYGYAMSTLISKEIMTYFDDVQIKSMQSINEFIANDDKMFENIDLVITTVNGIADERVEVILIDYLDIQKSINEIILVKNKILNKQFSYFLNSSYQEINYIAKTRKQVYEFIEQFCLTNKLCQREYINSLEQREELGNVVQNKICYLHGNNQYVVHNKVILIKLDQTIKWKEEEVDYIFLVLTNHEFLKKYQVQISKLYSLVYLADKIDNNFIEQIVDQYK